MRTTRATIIGGVVAAAALVVSYGGTGSSTRAPSQTWVDGYGLDNAPEAAVSFPGNEIVLLAEVSSTLPARWNTASRSEPGSGAFIYTPIRVRVLEILRGAPRLEDGEMMIRRLGGRVGDEEFVFSPDIAPRGLEPGNRVLLFLGEQRDVGDGLDAATPNMAYVVDVSGLARSSDGRNSLDLDSFRALLSR